jgi:hypothetical protein
VPVALVVTDLRLPQQVSLAVPVAMVARVAVAEPSATVALVVTAVAVALD